MKTRTQAKIRAWLGYGLGGLSAFLLVLPLFHGARLMGFMLLAEPPPRFDPNYEDRDLLMGYDPDACILCARCVRYTQEVMQCSALSIEGRGGHARIVPTWERSWLDTECELCGGCLSVCPTGAIYEKFEEGTTRPERSQQRHGERAGPHARLEHPRAGEDVSEHQDRTEVLRVDHLRAARHRHHVVDQ